MVNHKEEVPTIALKWISILSRPKVQNLKSCGPGCQCFSCKNVCRSSVDDASGEDLEEYVDSSNLSDESSTDDEHDQDEQEIMEAVFEM